MEFHITKCEKQLPSNYYRWAIKERRNHTSRNVKRLDVTEVHPLIKDIVIYDSTTAFGLGVLKIAILIKFHMMPSVFVITGVLRSYLKGQQQCTRIIYWLTTMFSQNK